MPEGRMPVSPAVPLACSVVYILDLIMGFQVGLVARWDDRAVIVRGPCLVGAALGFCSGQGGKGSASKQVLQAPQQWGWRLTLSTRVLLLAAADGRATARYYLRNGFTLDLIATIPSVVQLITVTADVGGHALRLVYILRLLRLAR